MEKSVTNLSHSLLQSLLNTRASASSAPARLVAAASETVRHPTPNAIPDARASSSPGSSPAYFNFPPALRQLLSQQGQVRQLLPHIISLQPGQPHATPGAGSSVQSANPSEHLLSQLLSLVSQGVNPQSRQAGESMTALQLRQFISQWFSTQPAQALTSPAFAAVFTGTGAATAQRPVPPVVLPPPVPTPLPAFLPTLMPALLQWLLVQRSGHSGLAQLLRASLSAAGAGSVAGRTGTASNLPPGLLNAFANVVQGSLQDMRLSQIHLADTSASAHPEYYVVVPYQTGDSAVALEWLLRKSARTPQQPHSDVWHFSLRFETGRYGPLLVKGSYQASQDKAQGGAGLDTLRFYLSESQRDKQADFAATLTHLQQRLADAGLTDVNHEVHVGIVPASLAPSESKLHRQRGRYGQ